MNVILGLDVSTSKVGLSIINYDGKRKLINVQPALIAANRARSINGIKIKRGENTKKKVIEWVAAKYPKDFLVELTRYGNPKSGTDDMADAVVVALAGLNGGENG